MPKTNVHITDIKTPGTPKVRVTCSCGVEVTTILAEGVPYAIRHIKASHGSGRFHYKDFTRSIGMDGKSRPVLGADRDTLER